MYEHSRDCQKFTGKERDSETGLDWFASRYFSGAQGRFTSPDSLMGKPEWLVDPQRWNRYAYVRNNPLRYIDPNGEDLVIYTFEGDDLNDEQRKFLRANLAKIQAGIRQKFEKAGVKDITFRSGAGLSKNQIDRILAEGRANNTTGIGMLNFTNKSIGGYTASDPDTKGATGTDSRSAVFMGNLMDRLKSLTDVMTFRLTEVGAHELGHGQGFESDLPSINFMKELIGRGNLMGEGQGTPRSPKFFDPTQDRTKRAIDQLNRISVDAIDRKIGKQ